MNLIAHIRAEELKKWSLDLGFDSCRISRAGVLSEEAPRLEKWLKDQMHGKMHYMENHFDIRLNPSLLMPNTKSVVSFAYNYFPEEEFRNDGVRISKYAYGEDYHVVIKDKLKALAIKIESAWGKVQMRACVDSAPILEKAWAIRSGIGWLGKNGNIITKKRGSFFFLAELLLDVELEPDGPVEDYCGSCRACIDACPTEAIVQPYQVDGSKCISYFTIELKENIPSDFVGQWNDWIFGCDVCQDVCPWNRFSKPTADERFQPKEYVRYFDKEDWIQCEEEVFKKMTKGTPLERTKWKGIQKNLMHLYGLSQKSDQNC